MLPLLKKWSDCMLRRHRLPLKMRRQLATTTYLVYICCHLWSISLLNFSTASWTVEWSVFPYPSSKLVVDWLRSPFFHVHLNEWDRFNQSKMTEIASRSERARIASKSQCLNCKQKTEMRVLPLISSSPQPTDSLANATTTIQNTMRDENVKEGEERKCA